MDAYLKTKILTKISEFAVRKSCHTYLSNKKLLKGLFYINWNFIPSLIVFLLIVVLH